MRIAEMKKQANKELAGLLRYQQSLLNLVTRCLGDPIPAKAPASEHSRQLAVLVRKVRSKAG